MEINKLNLFFIQKARGHQVCYSKNKIPPCFLTLINYFFGQCCHFIPPNPPKKNFRFLVFPGGIKWDISQIWFNLPGTIID